jgi:cytochrome bd ubiquinol oxidase subunit II
MLAATWFVLWGLLWAVYFMLDGFDLGAAALLPLLARDEAERRRVYGAIGPFWDGHEVWLIAAGGITFAAFPGTYAVMFSALYTPLMLVLFALILRGAAIGMRAEFESIAARRGLDHVFTIASALAAVLLGVAFANIFRGVPIDGQGVFHGNLLTVLNPYGLIGGALFLAAFGLHGALWIALKTEGGLQDRAVALAKKLWVVTVAMAVVFLAATAALTGLWGRYLAHPVLLIIPLAAVAALAAVGPLLRAGRRLGALLGSAVFIGAAVAFGLAGIYPALLPSSLDPAFNLTTTNSASGPYTLKIMLAVALVFVPAVIAYQLWVHWIFRGPVDESGHGY